MNYEKFFERINLIDFKMSTNEFRIDFFGRKFWIDEKPIEKGDSEKVNNRIVSKCKILDVLSANIHLFLSSILCSNSNR